MKSLTNSTKLLHRAQKLIPSLSQTFSKGPSSYVEGVYPTYVLKGKGSHIFDVDGNKYIDYVLGLGPIILGYNYSKVNNAIIKQLKSGISFSIPHPLEVELAEKINKMIPGAEMIRYAKTGSDAGTAAIRAARAYTKRNNIAYCGGGGVWHDWFTVITNRNEGIPKNQKKFIKKFSYNDINSLKKIFEHWKGEVSTVYMEPMTTEYPKKGFLRDVTKLARKHGAILIFDEVVSGFRLANGGAQEHLKIQADISVFGKGIGNGMPLAAITGKRKFMEKFNDIFYSTTYGGESLSLAAGLTVLNELETKPVIKHCWNLGKYFMTEFNRTAEDLNLNVKTEGIPVRCKILCLDKNNNHSLLQYSLFCQEMIRRGVFLGRGYFLLSYSHTMTDIKKTIKASEESMKILKNAIDTNSVKKKLAGKIMKQVITF